MDIREFLTTVVANYDRDAGLDTPIQTMLRSASDHMAEHAPGGLIVHGSGGKGRATFTPWFGFFDPDETTSPEHGVYVVYLFGGDLTTVTLSLNQGITALTREMGNAAARLRLAADATAIRDALPYPATQDLLPQIDLGAGGFRQRAYEAGNIAALQYASAALPSEADLRRDLNRMVGVYADAVQAKRVLLQSSPGVIASPSVLQADPTGDPFRHFKPKDSGDYVAQISGREITKSRRHEALIEQYGVWVAPRGFAPSTMEHPRDLVLRTSASEWLVEAKVVYSGDATGAVRAALGQLFSYRHFLYPAEASVGLVALFTEPIGTAYVEFLEIYGVASVWKAGRVWAGSPGAVETGLAETG